MRTFYCSRLKKRSMAALSPAAPIRPIDPIRPCPFSARWAVRRSIESGLAAPVGVNDAAGHRVVDPNPRLAHVELEGSVPRDGSSRSVPELVDPGP